jgi:glyoxylate carboligase
MLIFALLLTLVDIILVLVTGTMIQAADTAFRTLSLPEMVAVPIVPPLVTTRGWLQMALGLGDFFFAGLLGIQTFKKYGRKIAVISILAMAASFFIFETILLTYWKIPFPGTVMIICGWLPIAIGKVLKDRISKG